MNTEQMKLFITGEDVKLVEAMQIIDNNANGILFVIDDKERLCGVVSDGDIRRWILKSGKIDIEISRLMNRFPKYLNENDNRVPASYMRELKIRAIPITDNEMRIKNIFLLEENGDTLDNNKRCLKDISVVIMAGGAGTRLYPYTKILPKPLIPIGDIPIMERIINSFYDYGVTDFLATVNYRKNMIRSYFSDIEKKYNLEYVEENMPLGTAGSIRLIQRHFKCPFFVTNCDILIRTDYGEIYQFHQDSGNAITVVGAMKNDTIPYGVIHSGENGEIEQIMEKPKRSYFVNTGMYIINPKIIELIPDNAFFHMTHLIDRTIEKGYKVGMYPVSEDSFLDMGEFAEMKRMEEKLNIQ